MEATITKPNLFAAKKVKETSSKKTDKPIVEAPDLDNKVAEFMRLKNLIDAHTSELKMIEGDIKTRGKQLFMEQYHRNKLRPENFKIKDATGQMALFIVTDKYSSVDEAKAELLKQFDLIEEQTTYSLNAELVSKYGEILSDLILSCPDIAEEDKGQLISGEVVFSVRKGSIDRLLQYPSPADIFELINPICSLKK